MRLFDTGVAMEIAGGSLVITDAHTKKPSVFWNGKRVDNVVGVKVVNDTLLTRVHLSVKGDATLSEMVAAGIEIKVAA
jgi:hypothetical protein